MSYVLTFGEGEYLESYVKGATEFSSTYIKADALVFFNKAEANHAAEVIGCCSVEIR
ncbi:hypothetical protein RBI89_21015 [Bacillus subtilis]|uniref:hypothetical protein n=1 Tax=Bacillus subtilis TaxID=1423 RepID=UPI0027E13C84|nr:hypothetical protein [Bacillus subtilis]MDQ4711945.1 hypothetical protein [Bacillus subtilis]